MWFGQNVEQYPILSDRNTNFCVKQRQHVHHRGPRMRVSRDFGRRFGNSKCQTRFVLPTKVGLYKRKVVVDKLYDQCLVEVEDEVHALWSCDGIQEMWEAPFAAARMKNPRLNSMCDLVSFILEETAN